MMSIAEDMVCLRWSWNRSCKYDGWVDDVPVQWVVRKTCHSLMARVCGCYLTEKRESGCGGDWWQKRRSCRVHCSSPSRRSELHTEWTRYVIPHISPQAPPTVPTQQEGQQERQLERGNDPPLVSPLIAVPALVCNTTHIPTGSTNSPHTAGGTAGETAGEGE
jgi:hypothetical protein